MTTLPQTTSVRLPQMASGAGPVAYVPSAPAAHAGSGMTGADVLRVIRANFWLILIMLLLFGAGGFVFNQVWANRWPQYQAVGALQLRTSIPNKPTEAPQELPDARVITELRTQARLLTQDTLFSAVLKTRDKLRETNWFKYYAGADGRNTADAKEKLRDNFRATPLPDSMLLLVSMSCNDARDAKVIVEEVVSEHLEQQRRIAEDRLTGQTKSLGDMRDAYNGMIKQIAGRVNEARGNLTKKGVGGGNFGIVSTKETELRELVANELKVSDIASNAKGALERNQELLKNGQELPEVERQIDTDFTIINIARTLAEAEIQLGVQKTQRGEQHPEVARAKAIVEETQKKLDEQKARLRASLRTQYLNALEGQARETQKTLETLQQQVESMKKELGDLSREIGSFLVDQEEEKALRELYQQINTRWQEIKLYLSPENQMRIDWASYGQPEIPDVPYLPKLWLTLPAALALGLALALGIAFLREYMDDTVRSPRDITRVGQMNVLGIVADVDEDPQVANARLPIFDTPHSLTAEQFRQIRTRLQHIAGLDTNRSIMVTGPSPLDGKTTVAANLAAALALNGRKTLLVDANVRRPEVHRLFGLTNEKGFSDVLNGTTAFDEALRPTRIPNLAIMASGPKPMNPTELFESQLLVDFIERALEEYDHVIFDSGPFLVVSEPVAMAPRVDGVITVVRAHAESRGLLQRMRDQLRQVKAEHLGVVINAVRSQGGGYYRRNIKAFYNYNGA